jgi:hypothetical protein
MSLFSLDRGLVPMGAALGGFLSQLVGPSGGLMLMAASCIVSTLLIAFLVPAIRKLD